MGMKTNGSPRFCWFNMITIYYDVTLEFNEAYIQQSAHVRWCFDAEIWRQILATLVIDIARWLVTMVRNVGRAAPGPRGRNFRPSQRSLWSVAWTRRRHMVAWPPPAAAFVFGPHLVIRLKNTQDCQLKNSRHSQPRSCSPDNCGMLLRFPPSPDCWRWLLLFNLIKWRASVITFGTWTWHPSHNLRTRTLV